MNTQTSYKVKQMSYNAMGSIQPAYPMNPDENSFMDNQEAVRYRNFKKVYTTQLNQPILQQRKGGEKQ